MGSSCSLVAHTRNSQGEVVESKLFKDLLSYTSNNRELTKELYNVSLNDELIEGIRDRLTFDENGEITLKSLLEITHTDLDTERVLDMCNREIDAGEYSYEEAIQRLGVFNKDNQWNKKFMATITPGEDGKFHLYVTQRTGTEEGNLNRLIANQNTQNRLMAVLAKHGVSVDFLKEGGQSRYSTENAQRNANGAYALISIAHGEDVENDLYEEAGHFAVGALGNNPLVKRLEGLLTEDVQIEIFGKDKYESKFVGDNSAREAAGYLVGKALSTGIDKRGAIKNLAMRIKDIALKTFYKFRGDEVKVNRIQAEQVADKIARGFMKGDSKYTVENALSRQETLYSAEYSTNAKMFKLLANQLKLAIVELKHINSDMAGVMELALDAMEGKGRKAEVDKNPGTFSADVQAISGIVDGLEYIASVIGTELPSILETVNFDDTRDFSYNMARNAHSLREAHIILKRSYEMLMAINTMVKPLPGAPHLTAAGGAGTTLESTIQIYNPITHTLEDKNIHAILEDLNNACTNTRPGSIYSDLIAKEKQYYLEFLKTTLGSDYVERASRVVFKLRRRQRGEPLTVVKKASKLKLEDAITNLETDINFFDRWFSAMSNNPDIAGQIVDKSVKRHNKIADDQTNMVWDKLKALKARADEAGIDSKVFYEVFEDDGSLTGNFIDKVHWGRWEEEAAKMKREAWEKYQALHEIKDGAGNPTGTYDYDNLSSFERGQEWQKFFHDEWVRWHDEHSDYDEDLEMYVPKDQLYHNNEYDKLCYKQDRSGRPIYSEPTEAKQILDELVAMKTKLDDLVDGGINHRAPQFKGTFMNRVRNRGSRLNPKLYGQSFCEKFRETFCEDAEDRDFGSTMTYNSEEEMLYADALAYEKEQLNRLPLYGINKVSDSVDAKAIKEKGQREGWTKEQIDAEIKAKKRNAMNRLSTDAFYSMLAYAGMAFQYHAMNNIVDTLEVGKEVLLNRTVAGITPERARGKNKSNAFNRYLKYLDKQVYGISQRKIVLTHGIVLNKIANFFSGLASKVFLGGNVAGGLVNVGTGNVEIIKEALAGEFFGMKDWFAAEGVYFKHLPNNLWDTTKIDGGQDKLALFLRHFNTLNDNKRRQRDWNTYQSRWAHFMYDECLMLPYSSGDHYMQSMSFLALAHKQKLIGLSDDSNKPITMWKAYSREEIEYGSSAGSTIGSNISKTPKGKKFGYTLELKDVYFKTVEDKEEYKTVTAIIRQLNDAISSGSVVDLLSTQEDYLRNFGIDIEGFNVSDAEELKKNLKNARDLLLIKQEDLTWNGDDESAFMDKAREINDRLHGIYNDMDKTAFHQNIIGNMLLSMRGYALGMIQRRYGVSKYNVALGGETEGSMLTCAKVIMSSFTDRYGFMKAVGAFLLPVIAPKLIRRQMEEAGFSYNQYANMRRNFGDMMFIAGLTVLKMATAAGGGDDEEKKERRKAYYAQLRANGADPAYIRQLKELDKRKDREGEINGLGLANYFATRLLLEQTAFNTLRGGHQEWATLMSLTPAGLSVIYNLSELAALGYGAAVYDYEKDDPTYYERLKDQGFSKEEISEIRKQRKERFKNAPGREYFYTQDGPYYQEGDPKFEVRLKNILPFYRFERVLYHPYQAVESYQYGKKIRR